MLLALTACTGEPPPDTDGAPPPTDTAPPSVPSAVTEVQVTPTWDPQAREVGISLDAPGPVVVGCVADAPDSHTVVEVEEVSDAHTVHLGGLLADTTYTCAAAVPDRAAPPAPFEVITAPLDGIVPVATTVGAPTEAGFLLTVYKPDACSMTSWLMVLDTRGRVRWRHPLPEGTQVHVNAILHDGVVAWGGGQRTDGAGLVDVIAGETYRLDLPEPYPVHHDTRLLDDGSLLTLEHRTLDAPSGPFAGFGLRRHLPTTGEILWSYDSERAVREGDLAPGFVDPWHANWVDRVADAPGGPLVAVNLCFSFQLLALDEQTGEVAWIAGPGGDLELLSGRWPECQHGPELTADRLLTYDNGLLSGETSVVEYALDLDAGTATELWRWSEGWFEETLGDVDRLPGGTVLVTRGHPECWSLGSPGAHSEWIELDPTTDEVRWRLTFTEPQDTVYRAEWVDGCALFADASTCARIADGWARHADLLGLQDPP